MGPASSLFLLWVAQVLPAAPTELADRVGITIANLSILESRKAKAVRFSTLAALCAERLRRQARRCSTSRAKYVS